MHIWVSKIIIIGSDNGLSPGWRQAIIWTNAGISLLIGGLGTNFSKILSEIHTVSFKKMHLKMLSAKCRPFCLSLNVLTMYAGLRLSSTIPCEHAWKFHSLHRFVNSLWSSDVLWLHRSGSILPQVMACCLTAPSHYLNQYWLTISEVFWHLQEDIFTRNVGRYPSPISVCKWLY